MALPGRSGSAGVELIVVVSEWPGRAKLDVISGTPSLAGHAVTATPTTGDTIPSSNGRLLYAALLSQGTTGHTIAEEAGWTQMEEQAGDENIAGSVAYRLQTTAAPDGHTWTMNNARDTLCHVIAFKPVGVIGVGVIVEAPDTTVGCSTRESDAADGCGR